jgi:hypothetical protein
LLIAYFSRKFTHIKEQETFLTRILVKNNVVPLVLGDLVVAGILVQASRPLIRVLVINDNHCGLIFLLIYKNRLVR